jgi:hypothetical protein
MPQDRSSTAIRRWLYIEDLYLRHPISGHDLDDIRRFLYGLSITDLGDFVADLRNFGLVDVVTSDKWQLGNDAYAAPGCSWTTRLAVFA